MSRAKNKQSFQDLDETFSADAAQSTETTAVDYDANVREGETTRAVDNVTAKVPSIAYLALAVGSMAVSAGLVMSKRKDLANFVGLWAPSLLVIGLYNKLVKVENEIAQLDR